MVRESLERLAKGLAGVSRGLAWVELTLCKGLIALFSLLLIVNVTRRYVFNAPLFFAEELAVYILIWMAFLAISVSIHENTQVRLTMLLDALPPPLAHRITLLTETLVAGLLAVILVTSLKWMGSPAVGFELALTLGLPKWPFFLIIPVFSAAALIHVLARLANPHRLVKPVGEEGPP